MIQRSAYSALMRLAKQFPVVAITGPRQSGKSTLTKYAFPEKKYYPLLAFVVLDYITGIMCAVAHKKLLSLRALEAILMLAGFFCGISLKP